MVELGRTDLRLGYVVPLWVVNLFLFFSLISSSPLYIALLLTINPVCANLPLIGSLRDHGPKQYLVLLLLVGYSFGRVLGLTVDEN
jgi:hypothetical protein